MCHYVDQLVAYFAIVAVWCWVWNGFLELFQAKLPAAAKNDVESEWKQETCGPENQNNGWKTLLNSFWAEGNSSLAITPDGVFTMNDLFNIQVVMWPIVNTKHLIIAALKTSTLHLSHPTTLRSNTLVEWSRVQLAMVHNVQVVQATIF